MLATLLKMAPIAEGCAKIIEKKMDPSNCIWAWRLDKSEYYENLTNISFECIKKNYEKVFFFNFISMKILIYVWKIIKFYYRIDNNWTSLFITCKNNGLKIETTMMN